MRSTGTKDRHCGDTVTDTNETSFQGSSEARQESVECEVRGTCNGSQNVKEEYTGLRV